MRTDPAIVTAVAQLLAAAVVGLLIIVLSSRGGPRPPKLKGRRE